MSKKILSAILCFVICFSFKVPAFADESIVQGDYTNKTVILHTNDVHGSILNYAKLATLKDSYEEKGAQVILVDAGDYSQGSSYVSSSKGANAVTMMNAVGYDYATLGNHEFDYGTETLVSNLSKADFKVICADVFDKNGSRLFDASDVYTTESGLKIGFFGMGTPETQTTANPALLKGVQFSTGDEFYTVAQTEIDALRAQGADIVVCVGHLGVDAESGAYRSTELYKNVQGLDFMIDGHSHTVMTIGDENEPVQSTGDYLSNIGVVVIDNETKKIESNQLVSTSDIPSNQDVLKNAQDIINEVDAKYGEVFAKTNVTLNGDRNPGNRTMETNLGDLICDAMIWQILKDDGSVSVDKSNVVAIENGGGIRATVNEGDITKNDLINVLPFGNTINVIYVKGSTLLEALEASTQTTPDAAGAFPQVSGIEYSVNTTIAYDAKDETYPNSTYYGPKTIKRVTINSINSKPFDENETYAVITNDFIASGGDTYSVFGASTTNIDTGILLYEAVVDYITEELDSVVGLQYATPQNRIHIFEENNKSVVDSTCTEQGYTIYQCSHCDYSYTSDYKSKTEHKYIETIITTPTEKKDGVAEYVCEYCNDTYRVLLESTNDETSESDKTSVAISQKNTGENKKSTNVTNKTSGITNKDSKTEKKDSVTDTKYSNQISPKTGYDSELLICAIYLSFASFTLLVVSARKRRESC
jgi:2',3'-cyclic-nucleotide 2'-phosphodiesterase (5'-nucleotidase family)